MKILGGTVRGFKLETPVGVDIRPALARVRNSLFNIILPRLPGANALDLFAGTGSLGLESLSRGAAHCLFVEIDRTCYETIEHNIAKTKFEDKASLVIMDVFQVVSCLKEQGGGRMFDVIFVAPPYSFYADAKLKEKLFGLLEEIVGNGFVAKDGIMVVEYRRPMAIPESKLVKVYDTREYGQTALAFLEPRMSQPQMDTDNTDTIS